MEIWLIAFPRISSVYRWTQSYSRPRYDAEILQYTHETDPYDTDRVDPDLQNIVIQTSTWFAIAEYVKLSDSKLTALDSAGPGVATTENMQTQAKTIGIPE